jgi:acetylglutamate kinase
MRLLAALVSQRFVPVVACIGVGDDGRLLNVNADTLAGHLAARLGARRLVIAGTTSGVLDGGGATLALVEAQMIPRLLHNGTATAGMIAKLRASERALSAGVGEVVIVDGRDSSALESATGHDAPPRSTLLVSTVTQGA